MVLLTRAIITNLIIFHKHELNNIMSWVCIQYIRLPTRNLSISSYLPFVNLLTLSLLEICHSYSIFWWIFELAIYWNLVADVAKLLGDYCHEGYCKEICIKLNVWNIIIPRTTKLLGGILVSLRPSVRPSVRLLVRTSVPHPVSAL